MFASWDPEKEVVVDICTYHLLGEFSVIMDFTFFLSSCSKLPPESEGKTAHDFVFSLAPVGPEWTD